MRLGIAHGFEIRSFFGRHQKSWARKHCVQFPGMMLLMGCLEGNACSQAGLFSFFAS